MADEGANLMISMILKLGCCLSLAVDMIHICFEGLLKLVCDVDIILLRYESCLSLYLSCFKIICAFEFNASVILSRNCEVNQASEISIYQFEMDTHTIENNLHLHD